MIVKIDGYLRDAEKEPWLGGAVSGIVFGDAKGRFEDGTPIRTSLVTEEVKIEGFGGMHFPCDIITRNSRYRILNWKVKV
jgi:hypothetical protein